MVAHKTPDRRRHLNEISCGPERTDHRHEPQQTKSGPASRACERARSTEKMRGDASRVHMEGSTRLSSTHAAGLPVCMSPLLPASGALGRTWPRDFYDLL